MKILHAVIGVAAAAFLFGASPASVNVATAQSSGSTCTVVYQTEPDANGGYEIHYRCTDGRRYVLSKGCTYCAWDYRDER